MRRAGKRDTGPGSGAVIDKMMEKDLPAVISVEKASFSNPWSREAFLEEIRSNPYARCLVAREPGRREVLSAYICYWILQEELLINNLAVNPVRRRRGLGRLLLDWAMKEGREADCDYAYLEVRPSNEAAIRLYEQHGFELVRRRRGYYSDTSEDALVMRASLKALETG